MKYKLIGSNNLILDAKTTILKNRGIEDIERFLNLDESVIHDYKYLNNIGKALDCLLKHIENNNTLFIQVD